MFMFVTKFFIPSSVCVVLSGLHFLDYSLFGKLFKNVDELVGISMFSDCIFDLTKDSSIRSKSFNLDYTLSTNRIVGDISGLKISEQPIVSAMVPRVYPAKFCFPQRIPNEMRDHPYWSSYCYFFKTLSQTILRPIRGQLGLPIVFKDGGLKIRQFLRPSMHKLTRVDYYWHTKVGGYVSAKLNGVGAFMYRDSTGNWFVSLRGGKVVIPYEFGYDQAQSRVDYRNRFSPGVPKDGTSTLLFVELVIIGNHVYPFFIAEVPRRYKDVKDKRQYWVEVFKGFSSKLSRIKNSYPALSYKDYHPYLGSVEKVVDFTVPPKKTSKKFPSLRPERLPVDGVVVTDLCGNYNSYWKQVETVDVVLQFESGIWAAPKHVNYKIIDPNKVLCMTGIYECYCDFKGSRFVVGCYRPDKFSVSEISHLIDNAILPFPVTVREEITFVSVGDLVVELGEVDHKAFERGVITRPYTMVLNRIIKGHIPTEAIKMYVVSFLSLVGKLSPIVVDAHYVIPISLFKKVVLQVAPGLEPFYIWNAMYFLGFASYEVDKAPGHFFGDSFDTAFWYRKSFADDPLLLDLLKMREYNAAIIVGLEGVKMIRLKDKLRLGNPVSIIDDGVAHVVVPYRRSAVKPFLDVEITYLINVLD